MHAVRQGVVVVLLGPVLQVRQHHYLHRARPLSQGRRGQATPGREREPAQAQAQAQAGRRSAGRRPRQLVPTTQPASVPRSAACGGMSTGAADSCRCWPAADQRGEALLPVDDLVRCVRAVRLARGDHGAQEVLLPAGVAVVQVCGWSKRGALEGEAWRAWGSWPGAGGKQALPVGGATAGGSPRSSS
jgi:hypothetical protein